MTKKAKDWLTRRPPRIGVAVLVLLLVGAIAVIAAGYSLINQGDIEVIDEAIFRAYNPADATGSGVFDAFLRVGGDGIIRGYNTEGTREFDTKGGKHTHAILLSAIPTINDDPEDPGVPYREFQLDINQQSSSDLSLDEVEIWLTTDPNITGYPFGGTDAVKVYELDKVGDDPGGNNWVVLNYNLAAGSGKRDMILRIPNANFLADPLGADPNCAYGGVGCNTYVVLYTEFGGDDPLWPADDGFEEWGVELYKLAAKTGTKFEDLDGDGPGTTGPGLGGWTIYVDYDDDGVLDTAEPYDVTADGTGTDPLGYYEILGIVPGTYKVREVPQTGWTCSYPSPCFYEETFVAEVTYTDNDFGNYRKVEVEACKLEDVDTDPNTAGDRVPVAGWTVQLTRNGAVIDEQLTGDNGCYKWTDLDPLASPDYYDVHEVVPDDWFAWTPTSFDCDPIPSGGSCSYTFVNSEKVDVKACKLEDVDGNPETADDRIPVPDWTVQLTQNGAVIDEQQTGDNGCYTWEDLDPLAPPDYYDVHEVVPDDWFAWTPTSFDCDPIASGGSCSYTFVNSKKVGVEACKLEDVDTDPNTADDRVPVAGWTVQLTQNGAVIDEQQTGDNGCYMWTDLDPLVPPDYYDVHEVVPDDWFAWTPTSFDCDPIAPGESCSYTFVNSEKVDVKACKLEDVDTDPNTTDDRVPVAGWTVQLTLNGAVVDEQVTGDNGCYTWEDLDPLAPPDYYDVHEVVPDDWFAWTPTSFDCDPIASGESCSYTFVNSEKVDVKACKLEDVDGNPETADDRIPVPDWTMQLTLNGAVIDEQVTGDNGCYKWTDLDPLVPPDFYDVHEVVPPGWFAWTPTSFDCDPIASGGSCSYTFVNSKKVGVEACKLEDVDTDPNTVDDRIPVAGWTVKLTRNGEVIDEQLTGENGCYMWTDLDPLVPPDYYDVHEVVPPGWFAWTPTSFKCDPIAPGEGCSYTFVNSEKVDVEACKLEDVDTDPNTTDDRVPVPGWTVQLTLNGEVIDEQLTGDKGCYKWTDLDPLVPPDYYDVHEVVPDDWLAWTPTSFDCDPIQSGGSCSYTFVNSEKVDVKACKLEDVDGNPETADDRIPVPGWTVQLTLNGEVIDEQLTGDNGCYKWTDLDPLVPPDYYDVHEVVPPGWFAWTPTEFVCDPIVSGGGCSYTFINSQYATKSGEKWDSDKGVPLSGWTIELWDVTGIPVFVASDATDGSGVYEFDMVIPGKTYAVCEVLVLGYFQTFPDALTIPPLGEQLFNCTVLGSDYGPYGYQFSPSSGEEYLENDFANSEEEGCTYTLGYWKTHSIHGPAGPPDDGWYTTAGPYPPGAAGPNAPLFDSGLNWLGAFNHPPKGGNAWFILAHQWMAAYLNYYNDAGAGRTDVVLWLSDAAALLDAYDEYDGGQPLIPKDTADRGDAIYLAKMLDKYNSGDIGPGHCDDVEPLLYQSTLPTSADTSAWVEAFESP
jgi:hypothetical protein